MWDRYSVDDATEKEVEDASGDVSESKSGDSSLRDWFGKSRSSDGTPGWVQLGGKYAGKPCAKQPGQTTKPKCGSSKMKRNLDKDEEQAAFRRKQRQDPNPDRKGKAINVKTEEVVTEKKAKKMLATIRSSLVILYGLLLMPQVLWLSAVRLVLITGEIKQRKKGLNIQIGEMTSEPQNMNSSI